jgi:predicted nucleic acid-binding protein
MDYFEGEPYAVALVDAPGALFGSVISLLEIRKKLRKKNVPPETVRRALDFMRRRARMVEVAPPVAEAAADVSLTTGLHAIDALIYASARSVNAILVTCDNDFRGLDGVELPERGARSRRRS